MPDIKVFIYTLQNMDAEIAKAVLIELGLKDARDRQDFASRYTNPTLMDYFKTNINAPQNAKAYAEIAKVLRRNGKVDLLFEVEAKIISDVEEFKKIRDNKFVDRLKDGDAEKNRSNINAAEGAVRNTVEGLSDMDKGGGQSLKGVFDAFTSPVGSERFRQGFRAAADGTNRFSRGIDKLVIQTPFDMSIMILGGMHDNLLTKVGIENIGRSLNLSEMNLLREVFGHSVVLEIVRIKEGYAGIFNAGEHNGYTLWNNQRAITRGNTIYMKNNIPGSATWNSTLVHEMTHVWQNQNGGTDYMSEALYAQMLGDGYGYITAITTQKKTWAMLNPEQQGKLIQDAYDNIFFKSNVWANAVTYNGVTISAQDLTKYMLSVLPQLRAGLGAT